MRLSVKRGIWGLILGTLVSAAAAQAPAPAADPLSAWNDTAPKKAILKFVAEATNPKSASFIPPDERIATFDNDGTLWAEQPIYFQFAFVSDRIRQMAPQHPEWQTTEPFKSLLAGDMNGLLAQGAKGLEQLMVVTHTGMTTDEFRETVLAWTATARHPKTKKLYVEMVYEPMLELLAYMRGQGFKTYIVSGGGQEFMRPWTEKIYGIPPEQVVGSNGELKYELRGATPVLIKEPKVSLVDDGPGKPVGIQRFIGRRPVFAFGNSDGDQQMLEWTWAGGGIRFCGIVHHTDAVREWAYDRKSRIGKLDKAWDEAVAKGWVVMDMKKDWNKVFPFDD